MLFGFYDPDSLNDCGGDSTNQCGHTSGSATVGFENAVLVRNLGPEIDTPNVFSNFSFSVDLPAGDTAVLAYIEVGATGSAGYADMDFSHTLQFSIAAPTGVEVDSLQGIPIQTTAAAMPEPRFLAFPGIAMVWLVGRWLARHRVAHIPQA